MKRYYYYIIALLIIAGCSEDDGNYNYKVLNTLKIEGFSQDTLYSLKQYDTLRINPILHFDNEKISDLSYEWKINYETISTDPVCRAEVSAKPNGVGKSYNASLCITDNSNNLKYYRDFKVSVGTAFTNALYVLSEREDGSARLSFQRRDTTDAPLVHDIFENANPEFGSLGKKPQQVFYQGRPTKFFGVVCKEGDKKITMLDESTLEINSYYSDETIRGDYKGEFSPDKLTVYMGGMIAGNGKLYGFNYMSNRSIYRPIEGDYEFAPWVDANESLDSYAWITYDNKSEQFMKLEPGSDVLAYDKVTPLKFPNWNGETVNTSGQKFLAGGTLNTVFMAMEKRIITLDKQSGKAHFYSINIDFDMITFSGVSLSCKKLMESENLINEQSNCFFAKDQYWYIANKNTVTRLMGIEGSEPSTWFTADKGEVTTMMTDGSTKRLFIATYDGSKSYIYVIDILTKQLLETPLEMDGKIVSLLVKGNWSY